MQPRKSYFLFPCFLYHIIRHNLVRQQCVNPGKASRNFVFIVPGQIYINTAVELSQETREDLSTQNLIIPRSFQHPFSSSLNSLFLTMKYRYLLMKAVKTQLVSCETTSSYRLKTAFVQIWKEYFVSSMG